ncbi:hypothetical protein MRB53_005960 [Persea americana]|uniref:Uncharacterized protein n=1 Tax=Persea americana TaxID=3435 RepID=A0ACC2MET8_PERAE|nr:hypothetical protein MRB53_005960 [Persea americana]
MLFRQHERNKGSQSVGMQEGNEVEEEKRKKKLVKTLMVLLPAETKIDVNREPHLLDLQKVLKAQTAAKANGYSDVLYLDSVHKRYLEEVSSCNVFVVKV